MHVSDELTMKNAAKKEGLAEGIAEGERMGLAKGKRLGFTEGEQKAKLETARNLIKKNVALDTIAECTGLSLEEVQKLADELAKK